MLTYETTYLKASENAVATKMKSHITKQTEVLRRAEIPATLSLWDVCHLRIWSKSARMIKEETGKRTVAFQYRTERDIVSVYQTHTCMIT